MENYEEIKRIGRGNYGTAHLVRNVHTGALVVIKKIPLTALSEKERADTQRECQLLAQLRHPNILDYIDSFLAEDTLHIVTQYCEAGDMSKIIKHRKKKNHYFDEDVILEWFIQIAMAVDHIHSLKILHRDLKTGNVFLTHTNVIKLGDFGIAKVLDSTLEQANTVVGTPYYMSPEVCENKAYDFKSDLWAMGCILYELCTLNHAFDASNLLGLVFKIVQESYPPIPDRYSSDLSDLIKRLLSKNPENRPSCRKIFRMPFIKQRLEDLARSSSLGETQAQGNHHQQHSQHGRQRSATTSHDEAGEISSAAATLRTKGGGEMGNDRFAHHSKPSPSPSRRTRLLSQRKPHHQRSYSIGGAIGSGIASDPSFATGVSSSHDEPSPRASRLKRQVSRKEDGPRQNALKRVEAKRRSSLIHRSTHDMANLSETRHFRPDSLDKAHDSGDSDYMVGVDDDSEYAGTPKNYSGRKMFSRNKSQPVTPHGADLRGGFQTRERLSSMDEQATGDLGIPRFANRAVSSGVGSDDMYGYARGGARRRASTAYVGGYHRRQSSRTDAASHHIPGGFDEDANTTLQFSGAPADVAAGTEALDPPPPPPPPPLDGMGDGEGHVAGGGAQSAAENMWTTSEWSEPVNLSRLSIKHQGSSATPPAAMHGSPSMLSGGSRRKELTRVNSAQDYSSMRRAAGSRGGAQPSKPRRFTSYRPSQEKSAPDLRADDRPPWKRGDEATTFANAEDRPIRSSGRYAVEELDSTTMVPPTHGAEASGGSSSEGSSSAQEKMGKPRAKDPRNGKSRASSLSGARNTLRVQAISGQGKTAATNFARQASPPRDQDGEYSDDFESDDESSSDDDVLTPQTRELVGLSEQERREADERDAMQVLDECRRRVRTDSDGHQRFEGKMGGAEDEDVASSGSGEADQERPGRGARNQSSLQRGLGHASARPMGGGGGPLQRTRSSTLPNSPRSFRNRNSHGSTTKGSQQSAAAGPHWQLIADCLRQRLLKILGRDDFADVYQYLKGVHEENKQSTDSSGERAQQRSTEQQSRLAQIVGKDNLSHCFDVDQLIYIEETYLTK